MYKAIIGEEILTGESELAGGLISGLRDLTDNGFDIESKDFNARKYDVMDMVFKLEGIEFTEEKTKEYDKLFIITTQKTTDPDRHTIVISRDGEINNFRKAVDKVLSMLREAEVNRTTSETDIRLYISLDGSGRNDIDTGIGFFDHMLEQIARHGNVDLEVKVKGDLDVDEHHTVEDVGICLGEGIKKALGDKKGIKRFGFYLPMDDAESRCAVDMGGRPYLKFKAKFDRENVGEFPTELTEEFFRGLANGLQANIIIRAKGKNDHHKIEAIFKSFARSLNEACRIDERNKKGIPSTKGKL